MALVGEYEPSSVESARDQVERYERSLIAHPAAELQDGPVRHAVVARQAVGAERDLWWRRAVGVWPDCDAYQARNGTSHPGYVARPAAGAEA